MQLSLSFGSEPPAPVVAVYQRLLSAFGSFTGGPRLAPIDQLVRSLVSSRTYDELSWPAYYRLRDLYRPWETLMGAPPEDIEKAIAQVTHAEIKAGWLPEAFAQIVALKGALTLDFLAEVPVEEALAWLQASLPGVGDKVAASILNFSTLGRPVMVVDTHVWRVARRIGLGGRNADPQAVRRTLMDVAPPAWGADDFFDLHWLLKRLGQTLCQHSVTRCGGCPVAGLCQERQRALKLKTRRPAASPVPLRPGWNKQ